MSFEEAKVATCLSSPNWVMQRRTSDVASMGMGVLFVFFVFGRKASFVDQNFPPIYIRLDLNCIISRYVGPSQRVSTLCICIQEMIFVLAKIFSSSFQH